jgi:hypothetical protein
VLVVGTFEAPLLQYLVNKDYQGQIAVLPTIFASQDYGMALLQGRTIREPIDQLLRKRIHEPEWQDLLYKHSGFLRRKVGHHKGA